MTRSGKASERSRELIPGRLVWAPEQQSPPGRASIAALDLCLHGAPEGSTAGTYDVRHYERELCGRAFGPLGLESLLRFCRGLEARLQGVRPRRGVLVLTTPEGDGEYRANAAVLAGAYLVLRLGWPAARVAGRLGERDAGAAFACSWAGRDRPAEDPVMQVRDCWAGVELARRRGWIDPNFVKDDSSMDAACDAYNEQLETYDATWIVPGMLMVGADPLTVVFDSNPATCKQLFPGDAIDKLNSLLSTEYVHTEGSRATRPSIGTGATSGSQQERPGECELGWPCDSPCDSVHTVCKDYERHTASSVSISNPAQPAGTAEEEDGDYARFLWQSGVRLLIRANFDGEEGMPVRRSYSDGAFEPYGIAQANIRVVDQNGGLPRPCDIRRMLEVCEGYVEPKGLGAVMVHCKGGFGRSVVLACCLAVSRWDIPGSALLGWVRIARPGAITTRLQEMFLAQLTGRKSVYRDAQLPVPADEEDCHGTRCADKVLRKVPCQIQ